MKHWSDEKQRRFDAVYDKYANTLYRISFGILKDFAAAEDVVQDTYLAYLGKEHFRDEIHERAWLVRVAINKSKNAWKKNKRTAPLESLSEHGVSYEDEGVLKEVLSLPPQYKVPIQLHYLEGYSVEEVAGMLSLSVSAVKMRLLRGRELLKISLGEEK